MSPKEKALEIVEKNFLILSKRGEHHYSFDYSKECALVAVELEYNSLREMLFNLRSCYVIESSEVYIHRLLELIDEEQQVKKEIEAL